MSIFGDRLQTPEFQLCLSPHQSYVSIYIKILIEIYTYMHTYVHIYGDKQYSHNIFYFHNKTPKVTILLIKGLCRLLNFNSRIS